MDLRAAFLCTLLVACGAGEAPVGAADPETVELPFRTPLPGLVDLAGQPFPGLATGAESAPAVFVLMRTDCPISNRYAPEVERLRAEFAPRGVAFWRVYPDPEEGPDEIRAHGESFAYGMPALRDTLQELVRLGDVRVTPEALVFDAGGALVYAGRIDDRVTDFGKARNEPRVRDLFDVLAALAKNRRTEFRRTEAVGCPIPPL